MRIFAFHLLNDYSGSPKVLMQLLKGWVKSDLDVTMVTGSGSVGFLSGIPGVKYNTFWYRWAANPYLRLINFALSQLLLILKLLFTVGRNDIVYINTVLPFGAAILGKLKGCRVIYHIHETTMKPRILKKFLFGIAHWAAHEVIFVSQYLADKEKIRNKKAHILYNAIENDFLMTATTHRNDRSKSQSILMVCSLKEYKGVKEFVMLAGLKPHYSFTMVVNSSQEEIDDFFKSYELPTNLLIYATQTNLHPFYGSAAVVLNLSRLDGWVETFGLTVIEGMAYGLPAIVPPIGGITELVEDGDNGYKVDSRNLPLLSEKLDQLLSDHLLYERMCNNAKRKIQRFSEDTFVEHSLRIIQRRATG
jgi:glycosyltransferase involved in cell wall biosynthesis